AATRPATTSAMRRGRTTGRTGAPRATAAGTTLARRSTCRARRSATRTWTRTVSSATRPTTVTYGRPGPRSWDGRRTATAAGSGWSRGAGPGWTTPRGASRRSITAAGRTGTAAGYGCRAGAWRVRYTHP